MDTSGARPTTLHESAGAVRVRPTGPVDAARWDAFLAEHAGGWPLARYGWAGVLSDSFAAAPAFLLAEGLDGTIQGILAAYLVGRGRNRIHSLNRSLIALNPSAELALLGAVARLAQDSGAQRIDLSARARPTASTFAVREKAAVVLRLAGTPDATWAGLRAKTRNMIRKAERAGVSVERGFQNLHAFYEVYARRMLDLAVPIYGFELFRQIAERFGDCAELIVARRDGEIIGGILIFFGATTAVYPLQATASSQMDSAATQKLVWEAAADAVRRGIATLDMGESRVGSPVYDSKVNFGGQPQPVFDCSLDLDARASLPTRVFGRIAHVALRWRLRALRRPAGLWLARRGRLIF